jgi:hypothetical protein
LYDAYGDNETRVTVADTGMLGQEVKSQANYKVAKVASNLVEHVAQYKLSKGHHYTLTVYYVGSPRQDEQGNTICSNYDLTLSISHMSSIA